MLRNRSLGRGAAGDAGRPAPGNADLQASRRRLVTTADAERKRIERDLHDGAQQHLVALAVGIRLVRDSLAAGASPADVELLDELDRGVRESIASLRDLAHGIYPPLLRDSGLEEALRAAAKRSPLAVTVPRRDLGRHPEQVEAAVYFCCLEALANAGQARAGRERDGHAAGRARGAAVRGRRHRPGFDPASTPAGAGLSNMADRIGALGGEVAWRAAPGHGTVVVGRTPVPRRGAPAGGAGRCRWGTALDRSTGGPLGAVGLVARAELRTRWRGLVTLGLLFGLVGGVVLGTVAVADRTLTAYERLGAAVGVADAQVLLPAAHSTVFDRIPTMPGVTAELDTGRLGRPDQHARRSGSCRSAAVPTIRRAWPSRS